MNDCNSLSTVKTTYELFKSEVTNSHSNHLLFLISIILTLVL